ncbi:hypothetical protein HMPREF9554_01090 [Treponema phagedenis F0421]|nr:hypothetical protein HMPREF9554_01090 [Treponema phagedenis F0421]TYT78497.1 hypothetical protein FS559_04860 [Treponema phagedenis]
MIQYRKLEDISMVDIVLVVSVFILLLALGIILTVRPPTRKAGKIILTALTWITATVVMFVELVMLTLMNAPVSGYIADWGIAIVVAVTITGLIWKLFKKKIFRICFFSFIAIGFLSFAGFLWHHLYLTRITVSMSPYELLESYSPYAENSKVKLLDGESTLKLSDNLPRMNGAIALYPIYSAYARAVYPAEKLQDAPNRKLLYGGSTPQAYDSILKGESDIIFMASPSKEQEEEAKAKGVHLNYTAIGREAFIFFVNANNPIENLTIEEIKKIYSGEIQDWSYFDPSSARKLGKIKAFQRDENSGSQTALQKLMGDTPLMKPTETDRINSMGAIVEKAADFKNFKNSIGFSFRFYSTEMMKDHDIKLLKLNGVAPTVENIKNGTYPIIGDFYAVTRDDASENTLKLLEWIKGKQGMELLKKTGYTPIDNL